MVVKSRVENCAENVVVVIVVVLATDVLEVSVASSLMTLTHSIVKKNYVLMPSARVEVNHC